MRRLCLETISVDYMQSIICIVILVLCSFPECLFFIIIGDEINTCIFSFGHLLSCEYQFFCFLYNAGLNLIIYTMSILQKKCRCQFHFWDHLPQVGKNLANCSVINLVNNLHLITATRNPVLFVKSIQNSRKKKNRCFLKCQVYIFNTVSLQERLFLRTVLILS